MIRFIFFFICISCFLAKIQANSLYTNLNLIQELSGKVIDQEGEPLIGVNIMIKGTEKGVSTDYDGYFKLEDVEEDAVLIVSYIGFQTQEVEVNGRSYLEIIMLSDSQMLDEVVVVAYGEQKKVSITGSVSSVGGKELKKSSSGNFTNALAGRIAGLTAIQSGGGQPGVDDASMFLRGAATTNGQSPLILIDGVPRDNIRTLDPSEVESVTTLKDASATAVFGVRGANGVILIETRRGKSGQAEFNASFDQSFSSFTREPQRLHSWEYIDLRNEAARNDGLELPYSDDVREKFINPRIGLDPDDPDYEMKVKVREYMYPDHDYYREFISRYTPQSRLNVNASGGTDRVRYFVNTAYLHQGGNLKVEPKDVLGYDPSSKLDRYNFRANLDYDVSQSFRAYLNLGSYIERVNMPSAFAYPNSDPNWMMRDIFFQAQSILPITPGPLTIDGFDVEPGQLVDPDYLDRSAFEVMNRMGYRKQLRSHLNASAGADWDLGEVLIKGLSVRGMISYDSYATSAEQARRLERLYIAKVDYERDELSYTISRPDEERLSVNRGVDSRYNINMQGSIHYDRSFGVHDVTSMVLAQRDFWESTGGEIPFNVIGVAGRATYSYDNRYLAEVNLGYNGSEQFAPNNRFGFFPAFSLGWVMSNEGFLKNNNLITNMKLRGSHGKVGNDKIGGARFLYQSDITMGGGPLGSLARGKGINQGLLGNPNISWEVAEKTNLGLDVQLFRDLDLVIDVFKEQRSDILITRGTVPSLQGVPLGNIPKVNMGIVDNRGFDLEFRYRKGFGKDWVVRISGNVSMNKNKVKFIDEAINDDSYAYSYRRTGFPLGQAWGYQIDYSNGNGYFNSEEELEEYLAHTTYGFGEPRLGDFKYIDLNGDGEINEKDMAPIKHTSIPGLIHGFEIGGTFKNWDLSVFFQGVGKYSTYFQQQGVWESTKSGNYFEYQRNAWTPERYENGEKITYPALGISQNTNHMPNDFFIMDRSFVRLKNMEFSYTFDQSFLNIAGVKNLRLYISGQNLFTWSDFRMTHHDPEYSDALGYPITKMYSFGCNIGF